MAKSKDTQHLFTALEAKYPYIEVFYNDHTGDAGWSDDQSIKDHKHAVAKTRGYLVDEDKDSYKLACSLIVNEEGFGGVSVILKKTVIEWFEIEIE